MSYLLDTHSFLWFIEGSSLLSDSARSLIENEENVIYLSIASVWEMAIKVSLGKLNLSQPFDRLIPQQLLQNDISLLDITVDHTIVVASLPYHHRDPFDRLLVAQTVTDQLPLISRDAILDAYGIRRLW